jgi:4-amino-4-deoxy-L-arabinose transferase-like glycosyltransferase
MIKTRIYAPLQSYTWLIIPFLLVASMARTIFQNNGLQNLYTYQAEAFLRGKLNIETDLNELPGETVKQEDNIYVPFPPVPAILLTPFVALFGPANIKITLITAAIGCASCYLLYNILRRLELENNSILWMTAAFALGTAYWQTLRSSMWVWMFAQIIGVFFTLLSINEGLGRGRGILSGLFLGLAFLSRQLSIYTSIFLVAVLWETQTSRKRMLNIFGFVGSFGICILIYLILNYLRFGSFESGYAEINLAGFGKERFEHYGLFNAAYFVFNSVYMFLQGFHLESGGAGHLQFSALDPFGTSLLSASPFIIAAFFAKWKRTISWGAWLAIVLSLAHMMFYHNNGFIQYNAQRFTLDFMPILILLVALGFRNSSKDLMLVLKMMVVYSILLNLIVLFLVG